MSIETMTKLATYTVGSGGDSSVSFSNIPQTYTDLYLVVSARDNRATVIDSTSSIKFNDSTTDYSYRVLYGNGASAGSATYSVYPTILQNSSGATSSTFSNCVVYIPNYTSSNNKSLSADSIDESNNTTGVYSWMVAGVWSNTSAINKITITPDTANNYVQYSTFTLYGVKALRTATASGGTAFGGTYKFDGTYYYHTFTATDTLVVSKPITVDYLVVAGGAGGGGGYGGGGGAGGFRTSATTSGGGSVAESRLFLDRGSYTVTVGAGGAGGAAGYGSANGTNGSNSVFSSITSTGGGGGGNSRAGSNGGSGGGGNDGFAGGTGTANQGYAGSAGTNSNKYGAGGGGGAGAVGGTAYTQSRLKKKQGPEQLQNLLAPPALLGGHILKK